MMTTQNKIITHISLWAGFVGILFLLFFLQHGKIHFSLLQNILLGAILFYINYLFLIPYFLFQRKIALYVCTSLIVFILLLFLPTVFKSFWAEPILPRHFFRGRFPFFIFMQLFFFIAAIAIRFYEQWKENEKKAQMIRTEQITSELHYLKNQINPHFLFNSLNSIYALTVKKSAQAPEAVITLSELMRYMLYETNAHFVPIEKELQYIENYIKLQRLRMTDSNVVTLKINGNVENKKVSPLLFISFIENAFKFGANSVGKMVVSIVFNLTDKGIHFYCKNTIGDTPRTKDVPEGIGLKNTRDRLELLYPGKHLLHIEHTDVDYIVDLQLKDANL